MYGWATVSDFAVALLYLSRLRGLFVRAALSTLAPRGSVDPVQKVTANLGIHPRVQRGGWDAAPAGVRARVLPLVPAARHGLRGRRGGT